MSEHSIELITFITYKFLGFFSGTFICYWGYKLFVKGIFTDAGELDARYGNNNVLLKKAAPGTFFALFGAIIISISILKGSYRNENTIPTQQKEFPNERPDTTIKVPSKPPF